jgi:hypothetical protein
VRRHDPIAHTSGRVLSWGLLDEARMKEMRDAIRATVNAAGDDADGAADPDPSTADQHIFSGSQPVTVEREPRAISTRAGHDDRRVESRASRRDGAKPEDRDVGAKTLPTRRGASSA